MGDMGTTIPTHRQVRRNPAGHKWLKGLSLANLDALSRDSEAMDSLIEMDSVQLVKQLGFALANVSGGRFVSVGYVAYLPVSQGYLVAIGLDASDTYTVRRLVMRGGKISEKGTCEGVYCDELAEVAIKAGSYRSYGDDWAVA